MLKVNEKYGLRGEHIGVSWIEHFGYQYFNNAYTLEWHQHDGFELTVSFRNDIEWELVNAPPLRLRASQLCVTQPNIVHRGGCNVICPSESLWVAFNISDMVGDGISQQQADRLIAFYREAGNSTVKINPQVHNAFCQLRDIVKLYYHTNDTLYTTVLVNLLREIIILSGFNLVNAEQSANLSKIQNVTEYIDTHYCEDISIDSLAKLIFVSKSNFFRLFQNITGYTPNAYIQKIRLEKAEQLLRSTDMYITDIAIGVGFSSSQYFANVFKTHHNISPSEYRAEYTDLRKS